MQEKPGDEVMQMLMSCLIGSGFFFFPLVIQPSICFLPFGFNIYSSPELLLSFVQPTSTFLARASAVLGHVLCGFI